MSRSGVSGMPQASTSTTLYEDQNNTMFKEPSRTLPSEINLGRNKVALKPGRSLLNWIQLTHSGADLTKTGGKIVAISPEELAKHNKRDDAWICVHGKVYNVTPYLEYHPGGEDELMRGIGKDATDLFNQIHRWVNIDSMLQKCFIGPLKASASWLQSLKELNVKVEIPDPSYDWVQTENMVHITIQNLPCAVKQRHIIIDLNEKVFCLNVRIGEKSYKFHMELEHPVTIKYSVFILNKNRQVKVTLPKESAIEWRTLGLALSDHNTIIGLSEKELTFRSCQITSRESVNYNTLLYTLKLPPGTKLSVPISHHISVKANVHGDEVVRYYTPILPSLTFPHLEDEKSTKLAENCGSLYLMIKIYKEGTLTSILDKLEVGEHIIVGDYLGNFDKNKLKKFQSVVMLAAGTGFTPMVKIIQYCIAVCKNIKQMVLIFCNKKEDDILWRRELDELSNKEDRFNVHYVLSEPGDNWEDTKGHLTKGIIKSAIPNECKKEDIFFCICGPISFNKCAIKCLQELDYCSDNMHEFC